MTDEDNLRLFHKNGGYVFHIPSNTFTPFIKRLGVYFLQLRVPKNVATVPEDLGRQDT